MKEATGELNMTVVTIIAIGAVIGLFWAIWPSISEKINQVWDKTSVTDPANCPSGQYWNGTTCVSG